MNIRPKTMRRLAVLLVLLLAIAGLLFGGYLVSKRRMAVKIEEERQAAMDAYRKSDFNGALPHFDYYLTKTKLAEKQGAEVDEQAAEALFAYGESRRNIEMPNGRHIFEAVKVFETYQRMCPDDLRAKHALLELYPRIRYEAEAIKLADDVLARDPADIAALRSKVRALVGQQKREEALAISQKLNAVAPHELRSQIFTQSLLLELNHKPEELVKLAEDQVKAHPNDAYFEVLLAYNYSRADQPEPAKKWLRAAAEHAPADLEFVKQLTGMLDRVGMTSEATQVVERSVEQSKGDPQFMLALVQRKWQNGENQEVVDRLAYLDPKSPTSDAQLLAFRALALYALDRPAEADPIVEALAAREMDASALSWATALKAGFAQPAREPRDQIKQYQAALNRSPDNAVIRFMLGQAYARLGETEPAVEAWERAGDLAPSWATPHAMMARVFTQSARYPQALVQSRQAYQINPNLPGVVTGVMVAYFNTLDDSAKPEAVTALLKDVEQVQAQQPLEPETLPIYVALLARTGQRDKAQKVIHAAMDAEHALPAETLARLAVVSNSQQLGAEQEIMAAAEKLHGSTPGIALRQALLLADSGKPQDGLQLLQKAQAAAKSDAVRWRIAVAEYRDWIQDKDVAKEWVDLGDANPKDLAVQTAVLRSRARFADRDFWQRSIDRAKKLTGEEGVLWRLERARWLLSGNPSSKDSAEAVNQLTAITQSSPTLADPHRLLANALERISKDKSENDKGDFLKRAADEMKVAAGLTPDDPATVLELTRLLTTIGRREEAQKPLDRLVQSTILSPQARKQTAHALASRGYWQEAIAVLTPAPQDAERDALMAALYHHTGKTTAAADYYNKVLGAKSPDATSLVDAADFFARHDQKEQAQKFLARLETATDSKVLRETLLGRYSEQHVGDDAALAHFNAAVQAAPADATAQRELAGFYLRHGKYEQTVATVDEGLKSAPDDADLKSLKVTADAMRAYAKDQDMLALSSVLSREPRNEAASEMFKVLAEAKSSGEDVAKTVARLDALAATHPNFPELQAKLIQGYLALKKYPKAESLALRAAENWPNDPRFAHLLVAVYHNQGPDALSRALDAARQWRSRSPENTLEPDVVIADMLLQLRRPGEAVETLQRYVAAAARPDGNAAVVSLYAQALIGSSRESEAVALLKPLAEQSAKWRSIWLSLAARAHRDGSAASKWITQVTPLLQPGATQEQQALAESWFAVGQQFHEPKAFDNAHAVLTALVGKTDAPSDAWFLYAANAEARADLPEAERGYREVLKREPNTPAACNNLAYVLLAQGHPQDLSEALSLAEKAIAAGPDNATFRDTRARIYAQQGNNNAAIGDFQAALKLDRDSLEAMIGLADVLSRSGQVEAAKALLPEVAKRIELSPPLAPPLQKQLDGVRSALKETVRSGRAD